MASPQEFVAQIKDWSEKALRNIDLVTNAAAEEVFKRATERQPSVKETGGSFEVGKVPVDTGFLVGTSELRFDGSPVAGGTGARGKASTAPDFAAYLGERRRGQAVELVFTAPYARAVEYGTGKMAGRLFVSTAIANWDSIVQEAAARFKD